MHHWWFVVRCWNFLDCTYIFVISNNTMRSCFILNSCLMLCLNLFPDFLIRYPNNNVDNDHFSKPFRTLREREKTFIGFTRINCAKRYTYEPVSATQHVKCAQFKFVSVILICQNLYSASSLMKILANCKWDRDTNECLHSMTVIIELTQFVGSITRTITFSNCNPCNCSASLTLGVGALDIFGTVLFIYTRGAQTFYPSGRNRLLLHRDHGRTYFVLIVKICKCGHTRFYIIS